jgi:hypothetical protein
MLTKHNGVDVMQAVQVGEDEKKSSSWGGGIWNGTANDTMRWHNGTDIRVNGTGIFWLNSTDTGEGLMTELPVGTDRMDEMGGGNGTVEGNGTDKTGAENDKKVVYTTVVVNATTSVNGTIAGDGMEGNSTAVALQTGESTTAGNGAAPTGESEGAGKGTKVVYAAEVVKVTMPGNGAQASDGMGANPTVVPPGESSTAGDGPASTGSPGGTGGGSKTKVVYATVAVNATAPMAANGTPPMDGAISENSMAGSNPTASLNVATPTTKMGRASMTIGGGPVSVENSAPGETGTGKNGAATTDAPGSPGGAKTAVQSVTVVVNATVPVNGNTAANGAQEVSGIPTMSGITEVSGTPVVNGTNTAVTETTVPDGTPVASSTSAVNGAMEGDGAVGFAQNGAMVEGGEIGNGSVAGNGAVAGNTGEPGKNAPLEGTRGRGSNETPNPSPTEGVGAQNGDGSGMSGASNSTPGSTGVTGTHNEVNVGAQNPTACQTTTVSAEVDVPVDSTVGQLELGNGVEFTVVE